MEVVRRFWHAWKRFGQFMGDLVGRLVLTLFYFSLFAPFGLGILLFGDPLGIKAGQGSAWQPRKTNDHDVIGARRLF